MATVSSYESLRHPSRSDLRQFAELFEPLYDASSDEARRQAVAALSQCPQIPEATARFIASRPIPVAAIFLTRSAALSDRVLIDILDTASPDHARAVARRDNLSPRVIEALVDSHRDRSSRMPSQDGETAPPGTETQLMREEALREEIKARARAAAVPAASPSPALQPAIEPASAIHQALMVRFARAGEAGMLAVTLADALDTSAWLSERILLDISGRQLATTLTALDLPAEDGAFILKRLYPHLSGAAAGTLLSGLDKAACVARVESWQRADGYTGSGPMQAANSAAAPQAGDNARHVASAAQERRRAAG